MDFIESLMASIIIEYCKKYKIGEVDDIKYLKDGSGNAVGAVFHVEREDCYRFLIEAMVDEILGTN